ncbi:MAG: B12-binding domain-containing radical SAM protein, partial [Promethearchaeota archaeon]
MTIALVKIANVDDRLVPLGLACLQAYLKQNNVPVKVFCFRPSSYSLAKFMINPLSAVAPPTLVMNHTVFPILAHMVNVVNNDKELDFTKGIFLDLIRDYCSLIYDSEENMTQRYKSMMKYLHTIVPHLINYSTVGFSVDYLNIVETVMATVFIRKINPSIQIIWGGPSITQSKEAFTYFLKKGVCDGLVIGEGEHPILQIAEGIPLDKVKGVMSFDGNDIIYDHGVQLNLDDLPTPDYTDIPIKSFFNIVSLYRSRGCTNRCSFCAEWFLFGPKFRRRSIDKVIQDIEMMIEKWKPGYIIFGESLINDDLEYFEQLCDKIIEKNFEMKFGTHFRANITPKIAKKA